MLEAGARPGGLIRTAKIEGFQLELGPQSFLSNEALLWLIESLGLNDQLLRADRHAPRYILKNGTLVPAPLAPPSLLTSPLLSAGTKWRIFTEMFRRTRPPEGDESIADFVRRKFGQQLLDYLVAPFVSGVYAGDPEKLSLRAAFPKLYEFESQYGSVLKGAMKSRPPKGTPRAELCSFRDGVEALPRALASQLGDSVQLKSAVLAVGRGEANGKPCFEIEFTREKHIERIAASAVIVGTPTEVAGEFLAPISETFAPPFASIEYAPVAVVSAAYRRDQMKRPTDGFGFLVPRGENLHVLGTVFGSSLFPGRAPEGMACLTSFAGGATNPDLVSSGEVEITDTIGDEVAKVLGISGSPVFTHTQTYKRALPQYNLGHTKTIATLQKLTSVIPGLFLAGNYLCGPAIGACVEQANQTADAARVYLASIDAAGVGAMAHA